ncbi:MAG: hypothetical protein ACI4YB_04245, partial [Oscillospiraceae bacterium]
MKNVLMILIMVICTLMGIYFSGRLKKKSRFLSNVAYMLEEIQLKIEYESAEVNEIITFFTENKRLSELGFLRNVSDNMDMCTDFGSLWENSVE